ncbi:MAG TPA: sigma-54 dependent transcriptional regulator [Gemmatimonadaceae bacterium]|nr:sigma-54 dependent transcriptional regulator [Gemmatimonadaceae bacterium]
MSATHTPPSVLVIDDETGIVETLGILLRNEGFTAHVALGGRQGLEKIAALTPDAVLCDVRMPGVGGLEILAAARDKDPDLPVILMTAQADLRSAIEAVNKGAYYFIQKPFVNDDIIAILRRATEHRQLSAENRSLKQEIRRREAGVDDVPVGGSQLWRDVLELAETVAPTDSTVLIQGESGTGKEVLARYIHQRSQRADADFLSINCGALPESLLESELFGHVKGSFTGAVKDKAGLFTAAARGTFFLDEIGETMASTQVKLLRVLQEREIIPVGATAAIPVDTRVIAATNRNLEEEINRGSFRSDLFYRLNVFAIHLPPLRDRRDDIPMLADAFLRRSAIKRGKDARRLTEAALDAMQRYRWPGNVRELENALERAIIVSDGDVIDADDLPERITQREQELLTGERVAANPTLDAIERAYIMWVLQSEDGNKNRAADVLGINPSTLYRKLSRYGVDV